MARGVNIVAAALSLAVAGCGSGATGPARGPAALDARARPALASAPLRPGEVLLRGDASPQLHHGVELRGTYVVRFQQYAPEDPRHDFARETPLVVTLRPARGHSVPLFHAAAATGSRRLRLAGRYDVDVSFGDFPYVLRFTPSR